MPMIDVSMSNNEPSAVPTDCDVCIVGSGPAGSTIARELAQTKLRVVLLESGGATRSAFADSLNEIENVGRPRIIEQWGIRNRIIGGSSHTWGGRCAPFDEIDFQARPWIPHSGWPIDLVGLAPYLERSASYLGLAVGTDYSDERFWGLADKAMPTTALSPDKLLSFFWQFSQDGQSDYRYEYMRFGKRLADLPDSVTLVANATVLEVVPVESCTAIRSLIYCGPDGRRRTLAASTVIICGGGIENARLLLNSVSVITAGVGNQHDLVGRYLMDHPRGPVGTFEVKGSEALQRRFGRYNVKGHLFRAGFRLSPEMQHAERLINCAAWLGETPAEDDPLEAVKRVASGRAQWGTDIATIVRNAPLLAQGSYDYFVRHNGLPRKLAGLTLDVMSEQIPDPESRITLSDRRDPLGVPLSRIDWRVSPEESRAFRRIARLAVDQLPRLGLPAPTLADWVLDEAEMPASFTDVGHPIGTTRMSDRPTDGVVDRNCQVHGIDGLFLCGTSTFPTAGHANPTQMVVAMALRLADHVKQRSVDATPLKIKNPPNTASKTVLVTGATGRIGHIVVEDFLERGYRVRATTSNKARIGTGKPGLEYVYADFLGDVDYEGLISGCDGIAHLAAEIGKKDRMARVNVEATRELAVAAERVGVKAFCYVSTVSVYGSGRGRTMAEDAPTLTVDRDIKSEYWALDYVRMYGRTKLQGELVVKEVASSCRYVIFRPTAVVDLGDIIGIRDWSRVKRILAAHRHSHYIYVRDVSDAIIWAIERGLGGYGVKGSVETFNLSEDEHPEPHHWSFLRRAHAVSGDPRYLVPKVPGLADWLHDFIRFRTFSIRNPLWRMRFPNDRLLAAGYTFRYGMEYAYARALDQLRNERMRGAGNPRSDDQATEYVEEALVSVEL